MGKKIQNTTSEKGFQTKISEIQNIFQKCKLGNVFWKRGFRSILLSTPAFSLRSFRSHFE